LVTAGGPLDVRKLAAECIAREKRLGVARGEVIAWLA
jgi:hypothetical protein